MKWILFLIAFPVSICVKAQTDSTIFSGSAKVNSISFLYKTIGNSGASVNVPGKGIYVWCDTCVSMANDTTNFCRINPGKGWINTFTTTNTSAIPAFQKLNQTVNNITTVVAKVDSAAPYLRISKNTNLALSTSWQTVNFSPGATVQDMNGFSTDTLAGKKYVWYDTTLINRLLKFSMLGGANFLATLYMTTTATVITTRATIQYRFVIPAGNADGTDYTFPFPNNGGFEDLQEVTILAGGNMNISKVIPIYLGNSLRSKGMYLQVRLSGIVLGTVTLNAAAFLIQQTK